MAQIDAAAVLKKFIAQHQRRKDAAAELGISPQYLSDLAYGSRPIPDHVLERLGLRRVTRIERMRKRKVAAA